jgi:hypothetical protein
MVARRLSKIHRGASMWNASPGWNQRGVLRKKGPKEMEWRRSGERWFRTSVLTWRREMRVRMGLREIGSLSVLVVVVEVVFGPDGKERSMGSKDWPAR